MTFNNSNPQEVKAFMMSPHIYLKIIDRENPIGADEVNRSICIRGDKDAQIELRDPETKQWYRFSNFIVAGEGFYMEGENPLPTYKEFMPEVNFRFKGGKRI